MTIITTQSRITYAGDNVTTGFPIPFEYFLNSDITAVKTAVGGGVAILVQNVDYTLAGAGVVGGGSATKTTPLLTGESLAFFLNPPITQASHYISNSPFPSATLENDIDRQAQISQRLADLLSRALHAPDGDPAAGTVGFALPSSVARANTNLGFDNNGSPALFSALLSATLSAASIGGFLYPQTPAEATASVTPTYYFYPTFDVRRYNADPTNTNDSATAINNAVAVAAVNGGTLKGFLGTFKCNSGITINSNNVYLQGEAQACSTLSFTYASGDLLSFGNGVANPNFVGASKLTITSTVAKGSGAAVRAQNVTYLWLQDLQLNANLYTGFQLDGGASQLFYYLDRFAINSGTNGVTVGQAGGLAQEVRISNGIMAKQTSAGVSIFYTSGCYLSKLSVAGNVGMNINPGNGQYVTALFGDQVIADGCTTNCWLITPTGTGVVTIVSLVNCWGCTTTTTGGYGFAISAGGTTRGITLTNFIAQNCQGGGISIGAGSKIGLVNCTVGANSQASNGTYHGAYFNNCTGIQVIGGSYGDNNARIANKQGYGLVFDTNAADIQCIGVNVRGNVVGGILDTATSTAKVISKNIGYNPLPSTAITVGASPFTWTNNTGDTVTLSLTGGTLSNATLAGLVWTVATNAAVSVPQAQSVVITYPGAAPTANYLGT